SRLDYAVAKHFDRAEFHPLGDRTPISRRLLGHPPSLTLDTLYSNLWTLNAARAAMPSSAAVIRFRLASSAKKWRPVRRISLRKIGLGNQCTNGRTVWNSTGNHLLGVVRNTALRATRAHSEMNFV